MSKQMGRVHIYCRVSSAGQEDNTSLDSQERACRAWADVRGLSVGSVEHEVWSGGDRHRPSLDALLERLLPGDVVLAYALDRLSRSQVDTAILIDRIETAGARLALVTEDFERSATGTFLRNAKAFVAELEKEKIGERTQRGRRARVASGKPIVGPVIAYGYRWNDDKTRYLINSETAPIVRMIFDWALDGVTLRRIASRLHERGIPSPRGNLHWTPSVIRNLLLRPVYTGSHVAYRKRAERQSGGGYKQRPGTPDELVPVPDVADPIVSVGEQASVAARLEANKKVSTRNNKNPEATLLRAGIAKCGHCGWGLAVALPPPNRPGSSAQYRCVRAEQQRQGCPRPTIAASVIDDVVWERVSAVLRDPEIIAREVDRHRVDGGLDRDLDAIEKQIATLLDKQTRTARAIAAVDDDDAAAPLIAELMSLAARKKVAEAERVELRTRLADDAADVEKMKSLSEWCSRVNANLESLTYDERRMALDALGVHVHVYRPGTTDDGGNPYPRWVLTMNPITTGESFEFPLTRR